MTIRGVDAAVALSIVAAGGDFGRVRNSKNLVSCLGLNPRVHQPGGRPRAAYQQGSARIRARHPGRALERGEDPEPAALRERRLESRDSCLCADRPGACRRFWA
jgi:transposase